MLCENNLPKYFWGEAIKRPLRTKTPYELYKGRKPNVSHLRKFGCKYFVLNDEKHPIGKIDAKSDKTIFMGYALHSKAYRVFNKSSLIVEESMYFFFETSATPRKVVDGDDVGIENTKEEPRNITIEESKDEPPLETLQRKENQHEDLPKT